MNNVTVRKLDPQRRETWRYYGRLLEQGAQYVLIEADFNRDDAVYHGVPFRRGDPFVEIYYTDRWYNVFEVHDRESGEAKCWYCNVSMPAEWQDGLLSYVDLALDLFVYPDGRQLVLDEDEFEALNPDEQLRQQAYAALEELRQLVRPQYGFHLA